MIFNFRKYTAMISHKLSNVKVFPEIRLKVHVCAVRSNLKSWLSAQNKHSKKFTKIYSKSAPGFEHICCRAVIIITTQFHSTKPELRLRSKSCSRGVGGLWWWEFVAIRQAGKKAFHKNHSSSPIHHSIAPHWYFTYLVDY